MRLRPSNWGARDDRAQVVGAALVDHLDLGARQRLGDQPLDLGEVGGHVLAGDRGRARGLDHLVDAAELDARAALRLAGALLGGVDRLPAGEGDRVGLALGEQLLDRDWSTRLAGSGTRPASRSSKIESTVSWASFLLVPITPLGPRLIQPTAYWPGDLLAGLGVEHAAALVGDRRRGARRTGMPSRPMPL